MFTKVLIANRGAIAVRIERTLRKLGIASVAVYTEADQDSLHVDQADEAVLIGEGAAKSSYLNAELILQTALATGAQAIHPGYGFLSENADFARACRDSGLVFIGPTPEQMEMFGLKHSARELAGQAGVPMLPGTALIAELEDAVREAAAIGYPVILKSTAGGGGIGMRVCADEAELRAAYDGVRHLAEANFKNGGMFLEKYIVRARHVEVQIFGNRFGEVTTLGERDCSIQRRNQKVLEESPAPLLPDEVRKMMFAAARRLAEQVGYRSAGTVEFLYDPKTHAFYFLEVNTRLQVEHGVTEEVLGIDLVEWMVREAADELRGLNERVREPAGHSVQVRIYAEDCLQQFRPSAGQLDQALFAPDVRVETWVRDGMTITTLYDPMLAKIIVHADTREAALDKLRQALAQTRLYGVTTNLSYVQALLDDPDCRSGQVYTRMLGDFAPAERALEVLDGGVQTTVQDWPGRTGYWDVGVPPCGPMDPWSMRIGNRLLGNEERASGLELTLRGGAYVFRSDLRFCLTGADMAAELDGEPVPVYTPVQARRGQTLRLGEAQLGMRAYLLVEGGLDMPLVLGSASTFTLGGFGGHGGRALRPGDVLAVRAVPQRVSGARPQGGRSDARPKADEAEPAGGVPAAGAAMNGTMNEALDMALVEALDATDESIDEAMNAATTYEAMNVTLDEARDVTTHAALDATLDEPMDAAMNVVLDAEMDGAIDAVPDTALDALYSEPAGRSWSLPLADRPQLTRDWTIGVIPGPHCTVEFLQPEYLTQLTTTEWEVHFNSSRTGVRLIGPAPCWAREDGGEAGLHPSNIHDNAYAVGTLDLTGDMPILLGPDGPSLGGFVCPVTTASAEFWKLGQLHAGDKVRFQLLTLEQAEALRELQEQQLAAIERWAAGSYPAGVHTDEGLEAVGAAEGMGLPDEALQEACLTRDGRVEDILPEVQVVARELPETVQSEQGKPEIRWDSVMKVLEGQLPDAEKSKQQLSKEHMSKEALPVVRLPEPLPELASRPDYPLLAVERASRAIPITVRCCGDRNLLIEYGDMELDLLLRFQVHALMQAVQADGGFPVLELTPGIRSLQIHFDPARMTVREAAARIMEIDRSLPPLESIRVPSRIVRLPLSWDDPATQLAIQRYQQNVRQDAPWCPSNLEFIRRVNGLEHVDDVQRIVFEANYLVLGLGDVYLGAPVATPVDPRHRLVTTKYNPARTWTPENAVGIGGAYMCVYGMEGPGGYQFVGRTVQMWNRLRSTGSFVPGKPWLLRFFDQIQFYPVEADELLRLRDDFLRGRFEADITETTFDLGEYVRFLDDIQESADAFRTRQQTAFAAERESWKRMGLAENVSEQEMSGDAAPEELPEGAAPVRSIMPGSVWQVLVSPGQTVRKGDKLAILESMKMEFPQHAPCDGIVLTVCVQPGDQVHAGQLLAGIGELPAAAEEEVAAG